MKHEIEEYHWLATDEAERWLSRIQELGQPNVNEIVKMLRRELSAERTHLLTELYELRSRARHKFAQAERMLLTRRALEQASDSLTADYKAQRFGQGCHADLCCGIGGDAFSLAEKNPTNGTLQAVERDPIVAFLAQSNFQRLSCLVDVQVRSIQVDDFRDRLVHLDPDRRALERRHTNVAGYDPGPEMIREVLTLARGAAIKVAPACQYPEEWPKSVEREWIEVRGECRQQVWWAGNLAANADGQRRATGLRGRPGETPTIGYSVAGPAGVPLSRCENVGTFLHEPRRAVLAAGLTGHLAQELELTQPFHDLPYLTSETGDVSPALTSYQVLEVIPFDRRRVRSALRSLGIGKTIVKTRGTKLDPAAIAKSLNDDKEVFGVVFLAGTRQGITAVISSGPVVADVDRTG